MGQLTRTLTTLAPTLGKLWDSNERLSAEMLVAFEQQFASSRRLSGELQRLVAFSEKQLARAARQKARSDASPSARKLSHSDN